MDNLKLESSYIHIKRILDIIEDWKHEYYLPNRRSLKYEPIVNDNEFVKWSHKNPKRVEFIIKNYSPEFKKLIIHELDKDNCTVKFIRISDAEYKFIVKEKSTCTIL